NLLKKKISEFSVDCWLVNTGWSGGVYGVGERISIKNTRHLLNEALSGNLSNIEMRKDENFGFMIPISIAGIDSSILNPRNTWTDPNAYDAQANKLINMFIENFKKFEADVDEKIKSSGPIIN
ncbi:phosphoenolpyruvate carboxykinase (ATP), partial [Pelagibacterales bacterium]|nr:phosphoenolpyruvate carboxykinase (ATP) [Pelagibacterales bacterium]